MNMQEIPEFKSLADARAFAQTLADAHAQSVLSLEAQDKVLAERDAQIASLATDLESERAALAQSQADLATARQSLQSLQAQIETLTKAQQSAEAKAAALCASVGVSPVAVSPKSEDKGRDLLCEFRSISDPGKQMAFYRKHREALNALIQQTR